MPQGGIVPDGGGSRAISHPGGPQDAIIARYKATYGNKLWRLGHLYKIRDKDKRLRPFSLNGIQGRILDFVEQNFIRDNKPIRAFFLKFRQGGVSTFWLLWWLDDAIFNPHSSNGILSHKHDSLYLLSKIIGTAYKTMPEALRPALVKDNVAELEFSNGSNIFTSLDIRSTVVHNLHISEWCFCQDDKIAASISAVPPTGNITGESTGNGIGNDGYITYQEAKQGLSPFKAAFFPWYIQSEYTMPLNGMQITRTSDELRMCAAAKRDFGVDVTDEQILWRRDMRRSQKGLAGQEFPEDDEEAFIKSGKFHFDQQKIITLLHEARESALMNPPVEQTEEYIVWEKPDPRSVYVVGVDTAEGVGGDYSVMSILNVTRRRQAFRLRAQMGIPQFFRACDKWGRHYNNALLGVEVNNHGHAVVQGLDEICHYPNLWRETMDEPTRIMTRQKSAIQKHNFGWRTTNSNRTLMLDNLKAALEGEIEEDVKNFKPEWKVLDQELLNEALTFVDIGGKYQASAGKHDDVIMATAIAQQMYMRSARCTRSGEGWLRKSGEREYTV